MKKTHELIEARIKDLERERDAHDPNDFLSVDIIEADIKKLRHMLSYAESLSKGGFAVPFSIKEHHHKGKM